MSTAPSPTTSTPSNPSTSPSAFTPISVAYSANAFVDSKYLYILGGLSGPTIPPTTKTAQFFSLDLSRPWTIDSPSWTNLKSTTTTPTYGKLQTAALSADKSNFLVFSAFSTGGGARVDAVGIPPTTAAGAVTWVQQTVANPSNVALSFREGSRATVVSYSTMNSSVVMVNGFADSGIDRVDVFNSLSTGGTTNAVNSWSVSETSLSKSVTTTTTPPPTESDVPMSVSYYGTALGGSPVGLERIWYFGGLSATSGEPTNHLFQSDPAFPAVFTTFTPDQTWPVARSGHCMVSASSNRIVVYGGMGTNGQVLDDVNVLDTMANPPTWKSSAGVSSGSGRAYMACGMASSHLVIFGGSIDALGTPAPVQPKIFNIETMTWETSFNPTLNNSPTSGGGNTGSVNNPQTGSTSSSANPKNMAAVLGGAIGAAVFLIGIITVYVVLRKRGRRGGIVSSGKEEDGPSSRAMMGSGEEKGDEGDESGETPDLNQARYVVSAPSSQQQQQQSGGYHSIGGGQGIVSSAPYNEKVQARSMPMPVPHPYVPSTSSAASVGLMPKSEVVGYTPTTTYLPSTGTKNNHNNNNNRSVITPQPPTIARTPSKSEYVDPEPVRRQHQQQQQPQHEVERRTSLDSLMNQSVGGTELDYLPEWVPPRAGEEEEDEDED